MDKGINQYGRRFPDFCKTNTLYIVNGRIGEDRYHGRVTCKGNSTLDYMIASPQLFTLILQFQIDEFSPLFSDVHSALHVSIHVHEFNTKNVPDMSSVDTKSRKRIKCDDSHKKNIIWDSQKRDEFVHSIDTTKVQEIVQTLTDNNNIDIDQVSFSICSLFDSAAKTTFRSRCTECIYESKDVENPWFNKEFFLSQSKR